MWPFNSVASLGGTKKPRKVSVRRSRTRCRSLRVELMESRVPLSASALLLTAEPIEQTVDYGDFAVEETLVVEETGGTLAGETLGTEAETVCYPVEPSAAIALDDSDDAALAETDDQALADSVYTALADSDDTALTGSDDATLTDSFYFCTALDGSDDALLADSDDALLADSGGATLLSGPAMPGAPMPGAPMPGAPIVADPVQVDEPQIVAFIATSKLYNIWYFEGRVVYDNPRSLTIVFGGVLQGHTTHVTADGTFSFALELPSGTSGIVSAQAFTPDRVASNVAWDWIS